MLLMVTGDMFAGLEDGDAIAHGCNCQGVMGAGVAGIVSKRWPIMYEEYRRLCEAGLLRPGDIHPYMTDEGVLVFNLMTQDWPGKDARLTWIGQCIAKMYYRAWRSGEIDTIRIPAIGAGIGGLNFLDVVERIERTLEICEKVIGTERKVDIKLYTLPAK